MYGTGAGQMGNRTDADSIATRSARPGETSDGRTAPGKRARRANAGARLPLRLEARSNCTDNQSATDHWTPGISPSMVTGYTSILHFGSLPRPAPFPSAEASCWWSGWKPSAMGGLWILDPFLWIRRRQPSTSRAAGFLHWDLSLSWQRGRKVWARFSGSPTNPCTLLTSWMPPQGLPAGQGL